MQEKNSKKEENTYIKKIPCIDCLILPICIQRSKPPLKPNTPKIVIPPFLSPLMKSCSLFSDWLANSSLYSISGTTVEKALKFFEEQYEKNSL